LSSEFTCGSTDIVLGLFQSDHDFDIIDDLNHEAGLSKLMEEAQSFAKTAGEDEKDIDDIHYSIYAHYCSNPDLVRKHLDSGLLVKMIAKKEATMLAMPAKERELEFALQDPCYVYVLLGACAMTLGCQLPERYIAMLKKVYTKGGLMPDALKQMKKALADPNGYRNGEPYDFESKSLVETANSDDREDEKPSTFGFFSMNVPSPGGLFDTGMGSSSASAIIKDLRNKPNKPNVCAGCGTDSAKGGQTLLVCSRCKDRKYCSLECQKLHWKVHKKLCEPAIGSNEILIFSSSGITSKKDMKFIFLCNK
jgi:hypothetical protein